MNLSGHIATLETELDHFKAKSDSDDTLIAVLKQQLELNTMETAKMAAEHAEKLRVLQHRHDEAVRNETEIVGVLNMTARGIVEGLRKRKGDQTPNPIPERPTATAGHVLLQTIDYGRRPEEDENGENRDAIRILSRG
jgi:hypothetical protein